MDIYEQHCVEITNALKPERFVWIHTPSERRTALLRRFFKTYTTAERLDEEFEGLSRKKLSKIVNARVAFHEKLFDHGIFIPNFLAEFISDMSYNNTFGAIRSDEFSFFDLCSLFYIFTGFIPILNDKKDRFMFPLDWQSKLYLNLNLMKHRNFMETILFPLTKIGVEQRHHYSMLTNNITTYLEDSIIDHHDYATRWNLMEKNGKSWDKHYTEIDSSELCEYAGKDIIGDEEEEEVGNARVFGFRIPIKQMKWDKTYPR